jgi:hypothetical protein
VPNTPSSADALGEYFANAETLNFSCACRTCQIDGYSADAVTTPGWALGTGRPPDFGTGAARGNARAHGARGTSELVRWTTSFRRLPSVSANAHRRPGRLQGRRPATTRAPPVGPQDAHSPPIGGFCCLSWHGGLVSARTLGCGPKDTAAQRARTPMEDVPSSVELRWRPSDVQAATSSSSREGVTAPLRA